MLVVEQQGFADKFQRVGYDETSYQNEMERNLYAFS